jgi:hypothetical protein
VDQAPIGWPGPNHSSVAVDPGYTPPKAKDEDVVPCIDAASEYLAVFKSVVSVQLVPFHFSVNAEFEGGINHRKLKHLSVFLILLDIV